MITFPLWARYLCFFFLGGLVMFIALGIVCFIQEERRKRQRRVQDL